MAPITSTPTTHLHSNVMPTHSPAIASPTASPTTSVPTAWSHLPNQTDNRSYLVSDSLTKTKETSRRPQPPCMHAFTDALPVSHLCNVFTCPSKTLRQRRGGRISSQHKQLTQPFHRALDLAPISNCRPGARCSSEEVGSRVIIKNQLEHDASSFACQTKGVGPTRVGCYRCYLLWSTGLPGTLAVRRSTTKTRIRTITRPSDGAHKTQDLDQEAKPRPHISTNPPNRLLRATAVRLGLPVPPVPPTHSTCRERERMKRTERD